MKNHVSQVGRLVPKLTVLILFIIHLAFGKTNGKKVTCRLGFAPSKKPNGKVECQRCAGGTYRNGVGTDTWCEKCPYNTYMPFRGVADRNMCISCPPGWVSVEGSTRCNRCPKGYISGCTGDCFQCKQGSSASACSCFPCETSEFSSGFNSQNCETCPQGMRATSDRTSCVLATCLPGKVWKSNYYPSQCYACEARSIRTTDMKECQECAADETVDYSKPRTECFKCNPGTYVSNIVNWNYAIDSHVCKPCPEGTNIIGFGKPMCRKTGEKCPKGTFEDDDGDWILCDRRHRFDSTIKKCIKCGETSVGSGGLSEKCFSCGSNSRFYEDQCECVGGYELQNGRCVKCPAGSFRSHNWLNLKSSLCGFNKISEEGAGGCMECPYGTYANKKRTACVRVPKCGKGLVIPVIHGTFSTQNTCVSAITGCPPSLKLIRRYRSRFCANSKGNIVCPKGQRFSESAYGDGDGPRCVWFSVSITVQLVVFKNSTIKAT